MTITARGREMTGEWCGLCGREIEREELNGKPAGDPGYCVGFDTCLQKGE